MGRSGNRLAGLVVTGPHVAGLHIGCQAEPLVSAPEASPRWGTPVWSRGTGSHSFSHTEESGLFGALSWNFSAAWHRGPGACSLRPPCLGCLEPSPGCDSCWSRPLQDSGQASISAAGSRALWAGRVCAETAATTGAWGGQAAPRTPTCARHPVPCVLLAKNPPGPGSLGQRRPLHPPPRAALPGPAAVPTRAPSEPLPSPPPPPEPGALSPSVS